MKILALDPGYDRCGIAVIERVQNNKEHIVSSSCFTTNKQDRFEQRLLDVSNNLRDWINTHTPDACALETLFFATNQKTAMHVAETRGALLLVATEMGVPVYEFTPKQVKIAVTGDGGASKQQVMMMLPKLISIQKTIKYDDEFDAIAVGVTASAILPNLYKST